MLHISGTQHQWTRILAQSTLLAEMTERRCNLPHLANENIKKAMEISVKRVVSGDEPGSTVMLIGFDFHTYIVWEAYRECKGYLIQFEETAMQ